MEAEDLICGFDEIPDPPEPLVPPVPQPIVEITGQDLSIGGQVLRALCDHFLPQITFFPGCQIVATLSSTSKFFRKYFLEKTNSITETSFPFTTPGVLVGMFYFFYNLKQIPTTLEGKTLPDVSPEEARKSFGILRHIRNNYVPYLPKETHVQMIMFTEPIFYIWACFSGHCVSFAPFKIQNQKLFLYQFGRAGLPYFSTREDPDWIRGYQEFLVVKK